jgi:hypothetical protein
MAPQVLRHAAEKERIEREQFDLDQVRCTL